MQVNENLNLLHILNFSLKRATEKKNLVFRKDK
jgi:hypothetical protein